MRAQWRVAEERGASVVQVVASYCAGVVESGRQLCVFFDESRGIECDVSDLCCSCLSTRLVIQLD